MSARQHLMRTDGTARGGAVYLGTGAPATHDVYVPIISVVSCPDCGAAIGQHCVRKDGTPAQKAHRARRRMAVRARNVTL